MELCRELGGGDVARIHLHERETNREVINEGDAGTSALRAGVEVPLDASVGVVACVWVRIQGSGPEITQPQRERIGPAYCFWKSRRPSFSLSKRKSETRAAHGGWEVT